MAFVKGKSGNPSGRPKVTLPDGRKLSDIAKDHTEAALGALVSIMTDTDAPHAARVSAASTVLDRGWGRPTQTLGDSEGNALDWIDVLNARRAQLGEPGPRLN